jgi:hypothetical protein
MKRSLGILCLAGVLFLIPVLQTALAQPQGQITSPRDRASVRGLVPIEGIATHPEFQKYEVHYGPEPNPNEQWTPITDSPFFVQVVQGRLGLWDTTVIPDGVYSLRLRLVRLDGNFDEYFVRGIQVVNTQPTATPTPAETATPAPPTLTPSPTPTVLIGVPTVASPTPVPTSTPLPTAPPTATSEPMDLPLGIQGVSDAACWGAGLTLVAFVAIGIFFGLKGGLGSLVHWLTRRGREGLGIRKE